jgi:hypothetical protein
MKKNLGKLKKFIDKATEEIASKVQDLEEKLRADHVDDLDEDKLTKALECQKVIMLIQGVLKGSIKWLKTKNIKADVAISLVATNLDQLTKSGDPSLIANYTYMEPETFEDLEYHFNTLMTFLEAREQGWKPGVYTQKDVIEFKKKAEEQAKEYEQFVIKGKL